MRNVMAVACVGWSFTFGRGLTRRVLPVDQRDPLTVALAGAGFGIGLMTLLPLWVMLARPGAPAFAIAFCATGVLWLAGRLAGSTPNARNRAGRPDTSRAPGGDAIARVLGAATVLCCAAIVFDAAYWPFDIGDALALYAPFGRHLYETSTLPTGDGTYEAYPMLVPMGFALTHWVAGSVNEYIARLVPALLAVGAVGAGGALARDMASPAAGLLASALVALTPVFGRWASTGYTDVPAAFYVGLTAIFAWRWWQSGARRAMVLAGLAAGLAMWTKNSTLTLLPSLLWLIISRPFFRRAPGPRRPPWRDASVLLGCLGLTAGPWYLRNVLAFGLLVPPTALTDRAQHTLGALTVMLRSDQHFGTCGWFFTAALMYGSMRACARDRAADRWYVLLVFLLPFLAAWWWLASYDARFLVTVVPLMAAMTAIMMADGVVAAMKHLTPRRLRQAAVAAQAIVLAATAVSLRKIIEHKAILVRTPWLDDAGRHRVRVGGLYDLALALNEVPPASRVGGVPPMAGYYLDRRRFARLEFASQHLAPAALARDYDYVVYRQPAGDSFAWQTRTPPMLRTADGYFLYATHGTDRASAQERTPSR